MGHPITSSTIWATIVQVQTVFPFKNYITEGMRQGLAHIIQQIAQYMTCDGQRLLDIGCGPMDKTAVFQQLGFECYAVDDLLDPWHRRNDNLELILEFADRMGVHFHLQSDDDYSIPFPTNSFDVVTIFDVIEHLHESPRSILNSAGLHLKDGGVLCIAMPNAVNLRKRLSVFLGSTNYVPIDQFFLNSGRWRGHVREYTLAEMVYICKATGFEVLSATAYEGPAYDKLKSPILQLYLLFTQMMPTLRSSLCVVALKPAGWMPLDADADAFREALAASVPPGVR